MTPIEDYVEAQRLKEEGIRRSLEHAERVEPTWAQQAAEHLSDWLCEGGGLDNYFMCEEVRRWAEARGLPKPPDPRAWGGVMQRARRAGVIVKCGYTESHTPAAHLRPTQVWSRS